MEPSALTVASAGQFPRPESASAQTKLTVTSAWFHPAAFGAGEADAAIVGGVLSRLTVTFVVALLPAVSVAVPVMT